MQTFGSENGCYNNERSITVSSSVKRGYNTDGVTGGLLLIDLGRSMLYSPLAWVIIGGLITSTLPVRLVTPVIYKLLPPGIKNF